MLKPTYDLHLVEAMAVVFYENKKASSTLKAIDLFGVLFDKVLGQLEVARLAFWGKMILVSIAPFEMV